MVSQRYLRTGNADCGETTGGGGLTVLKYQVISALIVSSGSGVGGDGIHQGLLLKVGITQTAL